MGRPHTTEPSAVELQLAEGLIVSGMEPEGNDTHDKHLSGDADTASGPTDVRIAVTPYNDGGKKKSAAVAPLTRQLSVRSECVQEVRELREKKHMAPPSEMSFRDLSYCKDGKYYFRNVSGYLKPGMMCCVIGSPAQESGRKDLLMCLSGRQLGGRFK